MTLVIYLVLLALTNVVAPNGFSAEISNQAPLLSCIGQDISFDWTYITSTGIPPDTSRWFYKSAAGDTELMYTLQSNTEGRPTQLYAGRVLVDGRTQLQGTGITLINVSQSDTGSYFVELSFRLEFTLKLVSNEDNGTSLTVIDCPKEPPKIHKFQNRTIQCSRSEPLNDLELAIFKNGEQQTNASLDGDDLRLNVDNSSHGDYYCAYIYSSKRFMNIIGAPRSSTIHITEVGPTGDNQNGEDQNDDKKKGAPQYIKLVLGIAVVSTVLIVLGIVYYIATKRNTRARHRENEKQRETIPLQETEKQRMGHNEITSDRNTLNHIEIGKQHDLSKMPTDLPLGSGEPSPRKKCESVDIKYMTASNDDQNTLKVTEVVKDVAQVRTGNAYDMGAYTDKELQNIDNASELEEFEDTKIDEEVEEPSIFSAATQHFKKKYPKWAK